MSRPGVTLYLIILVFVFIGAGNCQRNRENSIRSRVRALEMRLQETEQKLADTQQQLTDLTRRIAGSTSDTQPAHSGRFRDDPPCPAARKFHYARDFRSCYHIEPNDVMVNWTEARDICRQLSSKAHLVSIETEAEQRFLQGRWMTERGIASLSRFWTSGRRQAKLWEWEGTGKPYTYTNWIPTTTHDDDRFSCTAVFSNEAYYWGDVACWAPHLVTCEINL